MSIQDDYEKALKEKNNTVIKQPTEFEKEWQILFGKYPEERPAEIYWPTPSQIDSLKFIASKISFDSVVHILIGPGKAAVVDYFTCCRSKNPSLYKEVKAGIMNIDARGDILIIFEDYSYAFCCIRDATASSAARYIIRASYVGLNNDGRTTSRGSLGEALAKYGTRQVVDKPQSSGCYVATCVYGSYDCPEVWTLRRFRDYELANTYLGRLFIKGYYAVSPTIVRLFGDTYGFKEFWRKYLDMIVNRLQRRGFESTPYDDPQY